MSLGTTFRRPSRRFGRSALLESLESRCLLSAMLDLMGVTALRADPVYAGIDGSGVAVAVLDSGVDHTHVLLQNSVAATTDMVYPQYTLTSSHGTHVAGIIAGQPAPAQRFDGGVAPGTKVIGVQVFTGNGTDYPNASDTHILNGLRWVLEHREEYSIVAVNMSLGGGFFTSRNQAVNSGNVNLYADMIARLESVGVTVVSAAGNSYASTQQVGSGAPGIVSTINVGAVFESGQESGYPDVEGPDRLTSFSYRPPESNVVFAPGSPIFSTVPNDGLAVKSGTSMASPAVAGVVALMQEAAQQFGGRLLSPGEVRTIIINTADTVRDGDDEQSPVRPTGNAYPRVNAYRAVQSVRAFFQNNGSPTPSPTPRAVDPNGTLSGAIRNLPVNGGEPVRIGGYIQTDNGNSIPVGDTDVDLFRIDVLSPGTIEISTYNDPDISNPVDTFLRLFSEDGRELAHDDDSAGGPFSRLRGSITPGVYYVGVSGYGNASYNPTVAGSGTRGDTGMYALSIVLTNPDPNGLISGAVVMDTFADESTVVGEGTLGYDYGQPVGTADVDLFKIVVPDDGFLSVDIDTPFSDAADTFIRVFDSRGQLLAYSDDDFAVDRSGAELEFVSGNVVYEADGSLSGHTTDSFVYGNVRRGQVYYIGISDYNNASYNIQTFDGRSALGDGGAYRLTVKFENNDLNGSIGQALDSTQIPLPVSDNPGVIGADGTPSGALQQVGDKDVDFVHVVPGSGGLLEMRVDSYGSSAISDSDKVDTILHIYDSSGTLLASSDNVNGRDPLLQYTVSANTDYYVAVSGKGNHNFDPHKLGSGSGGDTGKYFFSMRLLPASAARERNDDRVDSGGVTVLTEGSAVSGYLGSDRGLARGAADVDFYRFVAPKSGNITFRVGVGADSFGSIPRIRVFDQRGQEIRSATQVGRGPTPVVDVTIFATAGRTYYVGINGSDDAAGARGRTGDYTIMGAGAQAAPAYSQGAYTLTLVGTAASGKAVDALFDEAFYLEKNPDVRAAVYAGVFATGRDHFLAAGSREGRACNPLFDEKFYLANNKDVAAAVQSGAISSGFMHFASYGQREGRTASPFFSESEYRTFNPDVAAAVAGGHFQSGFEHYVLYGQFEKRSASLLFNERYYLAANPDVASTVAAGAFLNGLDHFLRWGRYEGRLATPFFSESTYRQRNPDIAAAITNGSITSGWDHFVMYGQKEGRLASDYFSESAYLAYNADIVPLIQNGTLSSGWNHFKRYGFKERRRSSSKFNEVSYLQQYKDVATVVSQGQFLSGLHHYLVYGAKEGRRPT